MASQEVTITLTCDADDAISTVTEMRQILERLADVSANIRDLPEHPVEPFVVDPIGHTAPTGETVVRIKPSEAFLEWLSALRTLESELLL